MALEQKLLVLTNFLSYLNVSFIIRHGIIMKSKLNRLKLNKKTRIFLRLCTIIIIIILSVFFGIWNIIVKYHKSLLSWLRVTLKINVFVMLIGIFIGTIRWILAYRNKFMETILNIVLKVFASIPVIVVLFRFHYPMQSLFDIVINPFISAVIVLSIYNTINVGNIIKTAFEELPDQYIMVAKTLNMRKKEILWKIQIPLILRWTIPQLITLEVNTLQTSLFASFIWVEDLFRMAQRVNLATYKPVEVYTALWLFFIIICLPLNWLADFLKEKFTRDISEN